MKMRFIIIMFIILCSCTITNPYYFNLRAEKREKYNLENIVLSDSLFLTEDYDVYSINSKNFNQYINKTKKYTLLIFSTYWCPNSREYTPIINNELKEQENLNIIIVTPDDWVRKFHYKNYIKNTDLKNNIFILDVYNYGKWRSPHKRQEAFISEILSEWEGSVIGFPKLLLFNNEKFITKYIKTKEEILNYLIE